MLDLQIMLGTLGTALLQSSLASNQVDTSLQAIARAYGRPEIRIFALPTLIVIEDPALERQGIYPVTNTQLRLEQAGAIDKLVQRAIKERIAPDEVIGEVTRVTTSAPRFGFFTSLLGYLVLTLGFGLVMNPTLESLLIYAILGVSVGLIVLLGSRMRALALVIPVLAAFTATVIVALLNPLITDGNTLLLVAPALASLFPGIALTVAAVELTNGQIMAGTTRLVYGFARLGLLAFGVYVGIAATGASISNHTPPDRLGLWAPWAGIVLVGIGFYLYQAAPKGSIFWIIFALAVAHAGQLFGHLILNPALSGMIGALIAVPMIHLVSHLASAPPPPVMLTCAYWILVPGALSFIDLSEAVSGSAGASEMMLQTSGSFLAIAIGMILGTAISRDTGVAARALAQRNTELTQGVSAHQDRARNRLVAASDEAVIRDVSPENDSDVELADETGQDAKMLLQRQTRNSHNESQPPRPSHPSAE